MSALVPRVALAPGYTIPRLVKGGWQLAGGHGAVDRDAALADMRAFVAAGMTSFDCADIYTGVEALIGDFVRARGSAAGLQIHTKYVPDLAALGTLTAEDVAAAVARSRTRLGVDVLDLVQFHWWDYDRPGMVEAARWLQARQLAGEIRHLGLTNCNTSAVRAILDAGVPIVSHQVQYSLLDQRPAGAMTTLCAARDIGLLCYGALAGGFFSARWLGSSSTSSAAGTGSSACSPPWPAWPRSTRWASARWPWPGCSRSRRWRPSSSARGVPRTSTTPSAPRASCSTARTRPQSMPCWANARRSPVMSTTSNARKADGTPRSCGTTSIRNRGWGLGAS